MLVAVLVVVDCRSGFMRIDESGCFATDLARLVAISGFWGLLNWLSSMNFGGYWLSFED